MGLADFPADRPGAFPEQREDLRMTRFTKDGIDRRILLAGFGAGDYRDLIAFLDAIPAGKRVPALKSVLRGGQLNIPDVDNLPDEDDLAELADDLLM